MATVTDGRTLRSPSSSVRTRSTSATAVFDAIDSRGHMAWWLRDTYSKSRASAGLCIGALAINYTECPGRRRRHYSLQTRPQRPAAASA